jgi:hypothetical protein
MRFFHFKMADVRNVFHLVGKGLETFDGGKYTYGREFMKDSFGVLEILRSNLEKPIKPQNMGFEEVCLTPHLNP